MAAGTVIYGISGDAVFRIRNTIEETTPYVAKMTCFPAIYIGILNTIGKVTSRVAKVLCFTIKMTGRRRRGGRRQATGARTGATHLRNRPLSTVSTV